MGNNFKAFRASGINNQDRQNRFGGIREPARSLHSGQGTVVNQNITVQNITI